MTLNLKKNQLGRQAIEVLKSMGIDSVEDLANARVPQLIKAFQHASRKGRYDLAFPPMTQFAAWIAEANDLMVARDAGGTSPDPSNSGPVAANVESEDEDFDSIPVAKVVRRPAEESASVAKPVVGADPQEPGPRTSIHVKPRPTHESTPVAVDLNPEKDHLLGRRRARGKLRKPTAPPNGNTESPPSSSPREDAATRAAPVQPAPVPVPPSAENVESTPFSSFEDYKKGKSRVRPLNPDTLDVGEDNLNDTAQEQEWFEEEQAYKKRMPRTEIRGIMYPEPLRFILGALASIAYIITMFVAVISVIVVLLFFPEQKMLIAWAGSACLISVFLYLILAVRVRCRTCSCPFFVTRLCFKHVKAHRIFGMMPLFASALHGLVFRWFRCMYCGTAIRLTKNVNHKRDND